MKLKPLVIAGVVISALSAAGAAGYGLYLFGMQRGMGAYFSDRGRPFQSDRGR